jgi:hypothetical protein
LHKSISSNKAIIPDRYPLPTMQELTEKVAGCTVFSKIDLLWSYTQLTLAEDRRYLTAFVTQDGVFQWKTLPFGLASGPSAFQKVVRLMLSGIECTNILDDILVYGRDVEEHDNRLRAVLDRLCKYGATVRADKCELGKPAVDFNGHHLSADGIRPLQSNVEAVERIPPPTNQRQLRTFIGAAGYYLKFVPQFAELCLPFRPLLKMDSEWVWSSDCQRAFELIKAKIAAPPTLAHFDVSADETLVTVDSSALALGACLSQKVNGVEKPVAFASRVLSPTEQKYSASEREALACLWACEHWNFYLYGRRFTLVTDCQALQTLLTAGGTGHRPLRLHRWCDRLYQYNFSVRYKPGRENCVVDCLSRSFTLDEGSASVNKFDETAEEQQFVNTIFGAWDTAVLTPAKVATETKTDQQLSQLLEFVVKGWPSAKRAVPVELQAYWSVQNDLSTTCNGQCIVRGTRLIVPTSLRAAVLELAHEGHPGIVRMKQRCRESVWWPGIDRDVENHVKDCMACVVSGKSVQPTPGLLQPTALPSGPWKKLAIDFAGEFVAAPAHQRYLIVAMDYYSKWPEVAMCGSPTTAAVITFLSGLFDRFGLVEEIVTDNGVQFTSAEFADFVNRHGIVHNRTALYNPQANAEVERFNRSLKEGIRAAMLEGKSFSTGIRQTLAAYRMMPHSSTGVAPSSLMLAFKVRTPLSLLQPFQPSSLTNTHQHQSQTLAKRVQFQQDKYAAVHDRRYRAQPTRIVVGDYVRIRLPRQPHKLAPAYSEPFLVTAVRGNCVVLANGQRWNLRRCLRHQQSLRPSARGIGDQQSGQPNNRPSQDLQPDPAADDVDTAYYTFETAAAARPAAAQQPARQHQPAVLRRSKRIRRPKDFGSFITY